MPSKAETVLAALAAAIPPFLPPGAGFLRNAILPARIPPAGLAILRDGDPGEPERMFSPLAFYYEHRAEIDVVCDAESPAARDAAFDAIRVGIGQAIAADRTLGGRCDWMEAEAPAPLVLRIDGDEGLKGATIRVMLAYVADDPLT